MLKLTPSNPIPPIYSAGICTVINLQLPWEHAKCGPGLERSGFTYEPEDLMRQGGRYPLSDYHPPSVHPPHSSPLPTFPLSLLLQLWLAGLWCAHVGEYPGYGEGGRLCSEGGQGSDPLSCWAGEDGGADCLLPCVLSEDEWR